MVTNNYEVIRFSSKLETHVKESTRIYGKSKHNMKPGKEIQIQSSPQNLEQEAKIQICKANQRWELTKKQASSQQDTFIEGLVEVRAQAGSTKKN